MKRTLTALAVLVIALVLSITALADDEFTIDVDGVLTKYSGSSAEVEIPSNVTSIAAGAFDGVSGVKCVIFSSSTCSFESASLPTGITVIAPKASAAFSSAIASGLNFRALDGYTPITIMYKYADGTTARPSYMGQVEVGKVYKIHTEQIEGYKPNVEYVTGIAGYSEITVSVVYNASIPDGWSVSGGRARYSKNGQYLTGVTEEIDGIPYTFGADGYLVMASGFLSTSDAVYYFSDSVAVTGYRVIGKSIYCFKSDGTMVRGTSYDGYEFDIGGNLIASDAVVTIGSDKYYLVANELTSGYRLIGGNIKYFGDDCKMLKNTTSGNYRFDADGTLVSGISASELEISGLSDVQYTGQAAEPSITVKFNGLVLTRDTHYKLVYSDNTAPGEAHIELRGMGPVSGSTALTFKILGEEAFTLTIKYVNVMGASIAETYTALLEPGESFEVLSPEVDGYKPSQASVSGIMTSSDMTFSVTYTRDTENSSSSSDTSDDTSVTDSSANNHESDPEESTPASKNDKSGYKYDYALFFKVLIISTVVAGAAVVVILNWDVIKKTVAKKLKKNDKSNGDRK